MPKLPSPVELDDRHQHPRRLHGTAAVLPGIEARGEGYVTNIAPVGGFVVQPTAAVYAATTFAVRAISERLRKESSKVRCTCIYPGEVTSELANTISDPTARADGGLPQDGNRPRREQMR